MESLAVLDISDLTRRFGEVVANDAVSLQVRRGDVVGLLGHNGAGKTTVVSQIMGLLRPHAGTIRIGEVDAVAHPAAARRHAALQPQAQAPIDGLTPRQAIELAGRIRGLSGRDARAAASALMEELDIGAWRDRRALPDGDGLSGGIRRLTSFAMAVAAPTPLIVLDEPTNDIDAARRRLLWAAVRRRADGGSGILVVTHNVAEAERVVDELVVLHRGRAVASGAPAHLRGADRSELRLELQVRPGGPDPSEDAPLPFAVRHRALLGRRVLLTVPSEGASAAVAWAGGLSRDGRIDGYSLGSVTLEDTYVSLTNAQHPTDDQPGVEEPIHD